MVCGATPHSGHRSDVPGKMASLITVQLSAVSGMLLGKWFELVWGILFHLDKYPVVMCRVLCSVCSWTVHLELQESVFKLAWYK